MASCKGQRELEDVVALESCAAQELHTSEMQAEGTESKGYSPTLHACYQGALLEGFQKDSPIKIQ